MERVKNIMVALLIVVGLTGCTDEVYCFEHYENYWVGYTLYTTYTYSYDCITYYTRTY